MSATDHRDRRCFLCGVETTPADQFEDMYYAHAICMSQAPDVTHTVTVAQYYQSMQRQESDDEGAETARTMV